MPGNSEINVTNLRRLGSPPICPVRLPDYGPGPGRKRAGRDAEAPAGNPSGYLALSRYVRCDTAARGRLTAQQYRERARLIRRQAEEIQWIAQRCGSSSLDLAEKYEKLADSMK